MGYTGVEWALIALSATLIGLNKAGLNGAAMLSIPITVGVFGAQASVGIVLPMLIVGDVVAVIYYREHADWATVLRLLPWTLVGIVAGTFVGDSIPESAFRALIAALLLFSLAMLALREFGGASFHIPRRWWTAALLGALAGFTSMVGNAAGPLMAMYLLAMGLTKNRFIGTGAWFFFAGNLAKVPFHVIFWKTITPQTLLINLAIAPAIILGAVAGLFLVRHIPERPYRILILVSTAIITVRLFF